MVRVLVLLKDGFSAKETADLKQLYGYNNVVFTKGTHNITSYEEVIELASDSDIIIAVLPANILIDLVNPVNNAKPVIQSSARTDNTSSCDELTTERLGSTCWEQVLLTALVEEDE